MERLRPVILIAQPHLAPLLPILAMQYDVMGLWAVSYTHLTLPTTPYV